MNSTLERKTTQNTTPAETTPFSGRMSSLSNSTATALSSITQDYNKSSMNSLSSSIINNRFGGVTNAYKNGMSRSISEQEMPKQRISSGHVQSKKSLERISSDFGVKKHYDDVVQDSVDQRQDFIHELDNRINSIKSSGIVPNFHNISKEDLKSFNFDKELDRLKRTLNDIKVQECRFIKLLSHRQSPDKVHQLQRSYESSPAKTPVKSPQMDEIDYNIANLESSLKQDEPLFYNKKMTPSSMKSQDISKYSSRNDRIEPNRRVETSPGVHEKVKKLSKDMTTPVLKRKSTRKRKSSMKKKSPISSKKQHSVTSKSKNSRYNNIS